MFIDFGCFELLFRPARRYRLVPGFRDLREAAAAPRHAPAGPNPPGKRYALMATLQMTDSQQVTATVAFADRRGNPAPPPPGARPPQWLVDNAALLALTPAGDGLSCVVAAVGPLGTGTVSVKVSDAGGNPLASGSVDVVIVGGAPTVVTITPGAPSEQP